MRILQIDKFFFNCGVNSVFFETIEGLRERGHEVAEFSMQNPKNRPSAFSRYFPPAVPELTVKTKKIDKLKSFIHCFFSSEVERRLGALVNDFRPDIAHIHNACDQSSASILATLHRFKVPTIVTFQETLPVCRNFIDKIKLYYYHLNGNWKNIRLFICPSEFIAKKMIESGFPKEKMRLIRNPYLLPAHYPPLGTKVVYIQPFQVNAEELKKIIADARVVVVTDGWRERCPFSILEAIGQGRIVVASRRGGYREIIIDGESGFLFSQDDPEDLERVINNAMSLTNEEATKIVERARQLVLRDHNPDQYFKMLTEVYEEALRH